MNVLLAGGGTGGHLFPGLALAEELRRRRPGERLLLLCTDRDLHYAGLKDAGVEARALPSSQRGSLPRRVAAMAPALARSMAALAGFRPHAVVGLGGYGSVAPVLCGVLRGIPSVLLEQNVLPGRSNRLLSRVVDEVACQWAESARYFRCPRKVCVTGNPVRSLVVRRDRAAAAAEMGLAPDLPTLLVMGGSQGARPINDIVAAAMPDLAQAGPDTQFIHLAGEADAERVRAAYQQHGLRARVFGFLADVALAYSACDLALSRAGGTSIAEFTALGIPCVLVPYPHAMDNHQHLNARVLEYRGAAVLAEQATLTPQALARQVAALLGDRARLGYMARQSQLMGVPRAAAVVADRIEGLVAGTRRERPPLVARLLAGRGSI